MCAAPRRFSTLDAGGVGRKSIGVSGVAAAIHRHTPDVIHLSQMTIMIAGGLGALASGDHWPRALGNVYKILKIAVKIRMERKGIASANVSRVNQSQILVIALTQQIRRLENKRKR